MPSLFPAAKPCPCGSGAPRRELRDAMSTPAFAGASLLRGACPGEGRDQDACEAAKRAEFDPCIFTAYPADEPIEED